MLKQKNVLLILGRYIHSVHRGVARYAGQKHWHLTAHRSAGAPIPKGWRGDGIITALDAQDDLVAFVRGAGVPVVDTVCMRPDIPLPRVIGDYKMIGQLAAQHFLERGLRHFAWYSQSFQDVEAFRFEGFEEEVVRSGFEVKRLVWDEQRPNENAGWMQMRRWLGRTIKALPKPLGVFAFNDYEASDVIDVCIFHKLRVPGDVAILGVDNNELVCDCQAVTLSSVNHDLERIGYEAAALLDHLMRGKPAPRKPILIPPRGITLRRSTDALAVNHPHVRKALQFVHANYHRSTGIAEVASAAGISRRALERLFKQHLNRSVHDQIRQLRLQHVREMLLYTDLSVVEIAAKTGFAHAQHLNNVFRAADGITPIRFRRERQSVTRN